MKKILIIYPHFPPSNLAGVHRPRLFAQHLPSFGWEPIILTVHEDYYEELPDWNLAALLPAGLRIEKVKACKLTKPRLIGDIGIRAFFQMYAKAKKLIKKERIQFVYIPVPSYYPALLGRWLHNATGVKYGIDYIDPWVHEFPGSDKIFSRHWFSSKLARLLEPIAVKKASLITGVAEGYYTALLERNPHLYNNTVFGAMPYGGELLDHHKAMALDLKPYLFSKKEGVIQLVYAGAMLPKAYNPLEAIFASLRENKERLPDIEFHFIGTGKTPDDPNGYNIRSLAREYDLWETIVYEYPKRIPYLDVLIHLSAATGVFILGSTEPHYTPSKVYQGVLAEKPVFAVLHEKSTAINVLRNANAGMVLSFNGENDIQKIREDFFDLFMNFIKYIATFDPEKVNKSVFESYSAKAVTGSLARLLDKIIT